MRPVLVGIAPSREGAEGQPLSALGGRSTGATLAALSGLSEGAYMRRFDRVNLVPSVRPSTISVAEGRPQAEMLAGSILRGRRVVLLGQNVAACFGLSQAYLERLGYCNWHNLSRHDSGWAGYKAGQHMPPFHHAILPHPSGRNLWYNDPNNRNRAAVFMTELAEGWEGAD